MFSTVKDTIHDIGCTTADLAKRGGKQTARLARNIGPVRGLVGLAIAGVAVGGTIFLVRYVRARRANAVEANNEIKPNNKRKPMHTHMHS